jgi:Flp pilus assembly protein TadG
MKAAKPIRDRRRRQAGQSLIEMAFSIMIVLTLILSIINAGYGVFCYHTISYAARDAVRYAVVRGPNSSSPATTAQIQQVAVNAALGVNLSTSNVTVTWPTNAKISTMKDARVVISYPFQLYMTPSTLTLTSTAQMLAEQ